MGISRPSATRGWWEVMYFKARKSQTWKDSAANRGGAAKKTLGVKAAGMQGLGGGSVEKTYFGGVPEVDSEWSPTITQVQTSQTNP